MNKDAVKQFDTCAKPDWCPGCGNFGIQVALKEALVASDVPREKFALVTDIGCGGKIAHWVNCYGLHALHGRAVPAACGVAWARPDLKVVCLIGDGGCYGGGLGHLLHAMRRDVNVTVIVHNNQVYGLTKGQFTPTSDKGYVSPSSPDGVEEQPVDPVTLAKASGCGFVARGYAGDAPGLRDLIGEALQHDGFSLIDVLQPCVTFNKVNTYASYMQAIKDGTIQVGRL